jgi:hypothetical protein
MRTMWLSIAACVVLLCWALPMPKLTSPAKPPPPCQTCYPEPDAGNEEADAADAGTHDAGAATNESTTDASGGEEIDGSTLARDAWTPVTTTDATSDTERTLKGSCDVGGPRPGPSTWALCLALAAAASWVRRGRRRPT